MSRQGRALAIQTRLTALLTVAESVARDLRDLDSEVDGDYRRKMSDADLELEGDIIVARKKLGAAIDLIGAAEEALEAR